ncbi:Flp pilus assembly protein CpaB [Shewanella schlegeliana]|uniref:Flp pilus assembly protein CpaB n=1 Tax=Shewanella schlegeliana TaxID=190308 RepID=A0ABS1SZ49_9GAMM|nr:Flp pilus assembly protein CpaB [Shewanella schlegeliana]MBL4913830.1 Flp pilus assembly protein CpaB [Shewanella schlegeliana]MCL1108786.1 Flp pilus assembly protein CpaB [Shewanella schlegeliana]GIU26031.1 Flp pilus assembly protein CpaB [Shewanella schlegeliana]
MNNRTVLFVILSLVFGVTAVYLAQNWLKTNTKAETVGTTSNVITMVTEVPLGTIIERKHLALTPVPQNLVPEGAITEITQAEGQVVKHRLYQGEVLRKERLTPKGEGSTLASLITPTMRAVTIRVNDVVGVAGFLLPGNRVDIINIIKTPGLKTDIVLSNVKILAIDQKASNDENKPVLVRAVTLELSLEQAETLMIAKSRGSLQLALRNPNDTAVIELADIQEKAIETDKEEPVKQAEAVSVARVSEASSKKVLLLKGMNEQEIKVDN